ncbi:MAG: 16S rRNA (cytosine(1402)-N(4))-methyltransferase RsmH [Phycisphaerales bacterium]|nr:16S rRNA (cytosine(1402)-N(4))-methyltransferase RsmH [Phycisphaerales bacterium]
MVEIIDHLGDKKVYHHVPVMLQEVVDGLAIKPNGVYVDCTFGSGGHSRAILSKLNAQGHLYAFDQDRAAQNNVWQDERLTLIHSNFEHLAKFMNYYGVRAIDGVVLDLGVSSFQLDTPERGFSTRLTGPLDMRMDQRMPQTALTILSSFNEKQLQYIFQEYGEVRNAKTLAHHIVAYRNKQSLQTTEDLKSLIGTLVKGNPHRYFAQVFQALRIEVNQEMASLKKLLDAIPELLAPGGRVVAISFHSLEDRLVKQYFKYGTFDLDHIQDSNKGLLKVITKKPLLPTTNEMQDNYRSHSAKLRIAEK